MATLSSPGLGSGLDIGALVTKLMAAEQQPLVALQKKEASYQAKISGLGSLKSALSGVQTAAAGLVPASGITAASKFSTTSAAFGDTTLGSATATNSAAAGTYTLSNITLAKAQQVRKSGMDIPAEAGTLTITVGSDTAVEVDIAAGATLTSIRDAINASSTAVSASIINDGTNDNLVLTADNSGATNKITIAGSAGFEDFNYSSGSANDWTEAIEASSASVKVNGLTVTSTSNTISTAIEGVTLTLAKETTGSTTLTVAKSNSSLTTGLNAFISAYNSAVTTMKNLGAYNSETKVASTLTGDSTLRSAQSQLRAIFFEDSGADSSAMHRLADIGLSVQLDGTLKLDSTKLNSAISSDFDGVANMVANVGTRFKDVITGMVGTDGLVNNRIDGVKASIKDVGKRQEALQFRLQKVQENYLRQFNALDVTISNMQSLSSQLTSQLASLSSLISN